MSDPILVLAAAGLAAAAVGLRRHVGPTAHRGHRDPAGHRRRRRRGAGHPGHVDRQRVDGVHRARRHRRDEPDQRPAAGRHQRAGGRRASTARTSAPRRSACSRSSAGGDSTAIIGYRASNSIDVKIRELDAASQAFALIVSTGGDATRINSVNYSIEDDSQLVRDARARAFNDAKDRAEQYAQLSGLDLGNVISISESAAPPPPPFRAECRAPRAAEMAARAAGARPADRRLQR